MIMQSENDIGQFPYFKEYPYSLLKAIAFSTTLDVPQRISKDGLCGMQYAFSRLVPLEQKMLWIRYVQCLSPEMAAEYLGMSETDAYSVEKAALSALRNPGLWKYIRYGVAGNLRQELQNCRKFAYRDGYCDGYKAAMKESEVEKKEKYNNMSCFECGIEMLSISERARRCLQNKGKTIIRDIAEMSEAQIDLIRGLGKKGMNEVAVALNACGICHTDWDKYLL